MIVTQACTTKLFNSYFHTNIHAPFTFFITSLLVSIEERLYLILTLGFSVYLLQTQTISTQGNSMYLEHVNLVVSDVEEMLAFYKAAFPHWAIRSEGEGEWYGKPRRWLHFGDTKYYIAISDNGVGENRNLEGHQTGLAHFAYVTDNIDTIIVRLQNAGYQIAKPGADNPFRRNVYFIDPAGFEIEFVQYLSDIPTERNNDL